MTEPTTRTQTFFFTNIEGSTKLLRALGSEYQQASGDGACSWQLIGAEERLRLSTGTGMGESRAEFPDSEPRRVPETPEERAGFDAGRQLTPDQAIALARDVALATG